MQISRNSPLKTLHSLDLNESKQSIMTRLLYVFIYYSGKISKHTYCELNEKYFMELITHVYEAANNSLLKNSTTWKDISSLLHSKGRLHGLSFHSFLEILPEVGRYLAPDETAEESLKRMVEHLMTVYESRVADDIEKRVAQYIDPMTEETREFVMKIMSSLTTVYKIYMPNEYLHQFNGKIDHQEQSFERLIELLREFEIFPKLISASSLYFIYMETLNGPSSNLLKESRLSRVVVKELGRVFTLSKFVDVLIAVSRIVLPKLREVQDPELWENRQKEMLKILLEYMETVRCRNKKAKFQDHRFTFIMAEQYADKIKESSFRERKFLEMFSSLKM